MKVFESTYHFNLEDIFKGHSQLLLRSEKDSIIVKEYNTDLIFIGAIEVKLPMFFEGIQINMEVIANSEIRVYHLLSLKRQLDGYYIKAVSLNIYENDLEHGKTSLGFSSLKGKCLNIIR